MSSSLENVTYDEVQSSSTVSSKLFGEINYEPSSDKYSRKSKRYRSNTIIGSLSSLDSVRNEFMDANLENSRNNSGEKKSKRKSFLANDRITRRQHNSGRSNPQIHNHNKFDSNPDLQKNSRIHYLSRGGTIVETEIGPIQIGIPPETIKDSLKLNLEVPQYFIVPSERFCVKIGPTQGLNLAEFEFPAYFNYFMKKGRKILLLVDNEEVKRCIQEVFQETLLGPRKWDPSADFSPKYPEEKKPQMLKELSYFQNYGGNTLSVDLLLEFRVFAPSGEIIIEDPTDSSKSIKIQRTLEDYSLYDSKNQLIAQVSTEVKVPGNPQLPMYHDYRLSHKSVSAFYPPAFGVTVLGSSHGFDPVGKTSGYVLWVNHRGLMIDPPPNSTRVLEKNFIPACLIEGVVVTHCHADHDAGTFQKILQEGRVTLMTTPTIFGGFVRKYAALSGLKVDFLKTVFKFKPVKIGQPLHFHGGKLSFFYTLHSIPCVGFEVFYGEKSIVFSADHMNDPEKIGKLHEDGVLTKARRDDLLKFPWHHDLILHEAGVPPIHTPISTLVRLPEDVKKRLYLVHVSSGSVPPESLLKVAKAGVENTIRIEGVKPPNYSQELQMIDLVTGIEMFSELELRKASEVFTSAEIVTFKAGETICRKGEEAESFYIIQSGMAEVKVGKTDARSFDFTFCDSHGLNELEDDDDTLKSSRARSISDSVSTANDYSLSFKNSWKNERRTSLPFPTYTAVERGLVELSEDPLIKKFYAGDYFGEQSLLGTGHSQASMSSRRSASIMAVSDLTALKFERYGFLSILEGTGIVERLQHLVTMRQRGTWGTIEENSMLRMLSPSQKTQLESYLVKRDYAAGDLIWKENESCQFASLVYKGELEFTRNRFVYQRRGSGVHVDPDHVFRDIRSSSVKLPSITLPKEPPACKRSPNSFDKIYHNIHTSHPKSFSTGIEPQNCKQIEKVVFKRGTFIGDIDGLRENRNNKVGLKATTDVRLLCLLKDDLQKFFKNNPGVLLSMLHTEYIL